MNNNKNNPASNMILPNLPNLPKQVINGKDKSNYIPCMVLQLVFCDSCKIPVTPQGLAWCADFPQLQEMAESLHSQMVTAKRVICSEPKILYTFSNGFIASDLIG